MKYILTLALSLITSTAFAQTVPGVPSSGEELGQHLAACQKASPSIQYGPACRGYQAGVITGILIFTKINGLPPPFCLPSNLTDAKIDTLILETLQEANMRKAPSSWIIIETMSRNFPCNSTPTP